MAEATTPPFDRTDLGFNALAGWTWVGTYGGYYLQADLLSGFEHGFFSRQWSGRGPDELAGFISAGVSVHRTRQIHGAAVVPAAAAIAEPWPEADGLVSDAGGQSLWVCGADCTPVLIADLGSGQVAACHAGWRGVAGRIVPAAIERLEAGGSRRHDLRVALGPAISGPAYQVHRSVSLQVAAAVSPAPLPSETALEQLAQAGARQADAHPDHDRLDIRRATAAQLRAAGLHDEQISVCPLCTSSEPLLFHSWRRDQVKAVQWSGIVSQGYGHSSS
ncbi:peptidoglycan editing factor PgeF [Synechococcus sp. L2F]|uniref:peptidoglycan editing factor PgeF n=1 Tax=Synechococcus sp. L2F TaxID=2823739 RepID=UPI0020CEB2A2|nr:peptidoglycan editing factor PgeF [Synechococcus sp. L2F]MCP9829419.1 peptidoglycan editing factor PgeF [Synechococcus sp. L2F]